MKLLIVGIHKADLLLALYNNARCQGKAFDSTPAMKMIGRMMLPAKHEDAEKLLKEREASNNYYFDYIDLGMGSRPLKVNLGEFEPDFERYDEYNGAGLAEKIVNNIRSQIIAQASEMPDNDFAQILKAISEQTKNDSTASSANKNSM
jgi:hypothetical protein